MKTWAVVARTDIDQTERLDVPGGYLYRVVRIDKTYTNGGSTIVSMSVLPGLVFVPASVGGGY